MAKRKKTKIKQFSKIYYQADQPASYSGERAFLERVSKADRTAAKKWLASQAAYNIHTPFTRKFKRRKIIANFQQQLQIDLVDLGQIAKHNDKYRYLLTAIDVFSKMAHVELLRKKDTGTVAEAFENFLDRLDFKPKYVHSDQGSEFIGSKFQNALKRRGIKYFSTTDATIKCAVIERFHRTLLSKLYRFFTKSNSLRYVEILPDIVKSYNNTRHLSTGFAPVQVSHENKEKIWLRIHKLKKAIKITPKSERLKVGAFVRIAKRTKIFDKGYKSKWSGEIFKIYKIRQTFPTTYNLVDLLDEPIIGSFYEQELNPTPFPETFPIESVLDSEKDKVLVKWRDYPKKFNSWVPKNSIGNI